jgi:hypothetical protein
MGQSGRLITQVAHFHISCRLGFHRQSEEIMFPGRKYKMQILTFSAPNHPKIPQIKIKALSGLSLFSRSIAQIVNFCALFYRKHFLITAKQLKSK